MLKIINQIASEVLADTPYFILESKQKGDKISLILDGLNGIGLEVCTKVAKKIRRLSEDIEELNNVSIEISSPGIDRPLTEQRQYIANLGRLVNVQLANQQELTGKLALYSKDQITIIDEQKKLSDIKMEEIVSTTVQLDLNY